MRPRNRKTLTESKPGPVVLKSKSATSLHERFSQVLFDQQTQSRSMHFNPDLPQMVLLVKEPQFCPHSPDLWSSTGSCCTLRTKSSVWTRLGWRYPATRLHVASRQRGFWSFMNKYRRRRFTFTCRAGGNLQCGIGQRRLRMNKQRLTTETQQRLLQRGVAVTLREHGSDKGFVLTRKQLDTQLDDYMSVSKSRLDQQLDDYMSMSRRRLDTELDEYMSMVGDAQWD